MEMRLPAKVLSLCFLCMLNVQIYELVHLSNVPCLPNQKLRLFNQTLVKICCFTIKCHPGQKFAFCVEDQGHDTCQNCPAGYTHADEIDTKDWDRDSIINPCTEKDDCSDYSDLTENKQTGQCECDRSHGFYGRDIHKCSIDDGSCKKAGYMLTFDGKCLECDEDHFKTSKGYELCQEKTRCKKEHEIDDPGSPRRDRTCRAKSSIIISTIKPAITSSNSSNNTHLESGKENIGDRGNNGSTGVDIFQNKDTKDEASPDPEEEQNSDNNTIVIAVSCIIVSLIILMFGCIYCYLKGHASFSCCNQYNHDNKEININANNLLLGDHNSIKTNQPEVDVEAEVEERTPLQEV